MHDNWIVIFGQVKFNGSSKIASLHIDRFLKKESYKNILEQIENVNKLWGKIEFYLDTETKRSSKVAKVHIVYAVRDNFILFRCSIRRRSAWKESNGNVSGWKGELKQKNHLYLKAKSRENRFRAIVISSIPIWMGVCCFTLWNVHFFKRVYTVEHGMNASGRPPSCL